MDGTQNAAHTHIMLVDDDPMIRTLFGDALRDLGYTVSIAHNHDTAIALLETQPTPNILVTDADLGDGHSGLDLIEYAQTKFPALPALLISGHHTNPTHQTTTLAKPFRLPTLVAAITKLLPNTTKNTEDK